MDEYEPVELEAMLWQKKRQKDNARLAELAEQQAEAQRELDKLKRENRAAELAAARKMRAKEKELANIARQIQSIEGVASGMPAVLNDCTNTSTRSSTRSSSSSSSKPPVVRQCGITPPAGKKEKAPKRRKTKFSSARSALSSSSSTADATPELEPRRHSSKDEPISRTGQEIFAAVIDGSAPELRWLLQKTREAGILAPALEWEDKATRSFALQQACIRGLVGSVRLLLEAGADPNRITKKLARRPSFRQRARANKKS